MFSINFKEKKLSYTLTAVMLLGICSNSYADLLNLDEIFGDDVGRCELQKVGEWDKTLWGGSIHGSFQNELIRQFDRKDDLFGSLSPEVEFALPGNLKLDIKYSKKVSDFLPAPTGGVITGDELFSYKVKNKLNMNISGGVSGPYLFADGSVGSEIQYITSHIPGDKRTRCDLLRSIIAEDERGREFMDMSCKQTGINKVGEYYVKSINYISKKIGHYLKKISTSESNQIYAEDVLSPLKLHATVGVPINHKIFFENYSDISIGDVIQHTTYFNLRPLGVRFDLFSVIRPSFSHFRRFYRTLAFKKGLRNKLTVEIEDTVLSGDSTEIYNLRQKFLSIFKYNFGKWGIEDFKEERLRQRVVIDLNKPSGVRFLKKLLIGAYTPSLKLKNKSLLVDVEGYSDSVIAHTPLFQAAHGGENKAKLRFPGIFKYESNARRDVRRVRFGTEDFSVGEMFHKKEFKHKVSLDLGLFKIKEKNKKYECRMLIEKDNKDSTDSAMNINCSYNNKFALNKDVKDVRESLLMTMNGKLEARDKKELAALKHSDEKRLTLSSSLSFSNKAIRKIISQPEDVIRHEVAKLFYGENIQNIFSSVNADKWKKLRNDFVLSGGANGRYFRRCSKLLSDYEITNGIDKRFDEFNGIVGRTKGIRAVKTSFCFAYYKAAELAVESIKDLRGNVEDDNYVRNFLDMYPHLKYAGFMQNLFVRLAGGFSKDMVRFTYVVASPNLKQEIVETSGAPFSTGISSRPLSILEEENKRYVSRISDISYYVNRCKDRHIILNAELDYPLKEGEEIFAEVTLSKFDLRASTRKHVIKVPILSIMVGGNGTDITIPVKLYNTYSWSSSHNASLRLINKDGKALTRSAKTFIRKFE